MSPNANRNSRESQNFPWILRRGGRDCRLVSVTAAPVRGWGKAEFVRTEGLHPETRFAETINVQAEVSGPTELKTLTLFKKGRFSRADIAAAMKGL